MSYIGNTPGVSSQRVVLEEVIAGSAKSLFTPIGGYVTGYVDVLVNGMEVDSSDFTATDGINVNLVTAAAVGDTVKIKTWLPRGLSDGYLKSEADSRFLNLAGGSLTGGLKVSTSSTLGNSNLWVALGIAGINVGTTMAWHQTYNSNAGADKKTFRWGGDNNGYFSLQSVNDAYTAATTLLTVDALGTIGLAGAGIAGWWPNGKQLQLGGVTALWDYSAAGNEQTRLMSNLYLDSTGSARYLTTNNASQYQQFNGAHTWSRAANGTAGALATVVDSMNLDANGNLVLNAASALYGEKLFVYTNASQNAIGGAIGPNATGCTAVLATSQAGASNSDLFGAWHAGVNQFRVNTAGVMMFNSGYGQSAVAYGCRAWVNWYGPNGSMRGYGNMSSVTRNGVGNYTLNFASAMPDTNYTVLSSSPMFTDGTKCGIGVYNGANGTPAKYTSSVQIYTGQTNSLNLYDIYHADIAIIR